MIRYSKLYTLHHVTLLDWHPFTHGPRPRPLSGTVHCTHYMHCFTVLDVFCISNFKGWQVYEETSLRVGQHRSSCTPQKVSSHHNNPSQPTSVSWLLTVPCWEFGISQRQAFALATILSSMEKDVWTLKKCPGLIFYKPCVIVRVLCLVFSLSFCGYEWPDHSFLDLSSLDVNRGFKLSFVTHQAYFALHLP